MNDNGDKPGTMEELIRRNQEKIGKGEAGKKKKKEKKKKGKKKKDTEEFDVSVLGVSSSDLTFKLPDPVGTSPARVPSVQKPVAKPTVIKNRVVKPAPEKEFPEELEPLPELPAFVLPEDIKDAPHFDYEPREGKGQIKEITWTVRVDSASSNVVTKKTRSLSPLMQEALAQVKSAQATGRLVVPEVRATKPTTGVSPSPARPGPATKNKAPTMAAAPVPTRKPAPASGTVPAARTKPLDPGRPAAGGTAGRPAGVSITGRQLADVKLTSPRSEEKPIPKAVVRSSLTNEQLEARPSISPSNLPEAKPVMDSVSVSKRRLTRSVIQQVESQPVQGAPAVTTGTEPVIKAATPAGAGVVADQPASGQDKILPGGRRVCGRCGGTRFREEDDKTRPLSFTPPYLYAKKYICKDCGKIFKSEEKDSAQETQQPAASQPSAVFTPQVVSNDMQATGPASAPRPAARPVSVSWEDANGQTEGVKVESLAAALKGEGHVKPSDVFAREGWKAEPLPGRVDTAGPGGVRPVGEGVQRLTCPNCGSTEFNQIEDRSRPLSYGLGSGLGVVYAKINQCKKCGTTFE